MFGWLNAEFISHSKYKNTDKTILFTKKVYHISPNSIRDAMHFCNPTQLKPLQALLPLLRLLLIAHLLLVDLRGGLALTRLSLARLHAHSHALLAALRRILDLLLGIGPSWSSLGDFVPAGKKSVFHSTN